MSPVPAFNENSDIAHEIAESLLEPNAEARRASRRGGKTDAFCRKAHRRRCRVATAAHFLAEGCYLVFQGPGGGVYFLHAPGHDLHLLVQGLRAAAALAHLPIHALDGLGVVLSRGPSHGGGGFMLAAMEEVVLSEETIPMMPLVKAGK